MAHCELRRTQSTTENKGREKGVGPLRRFAREKERSTPLMGEGWILLTTEKGDTVVFKEWEKNAAARRHQRGRASAWSHRRRRDYFSQRERPMRGGSALLSGLIKYPAGPNFHAPPRAAVKEDKKGDRALRERQKIREKKGEEKISAGQIFPATEG